MAERDELERSLALARQTLLGPVAMKERVRARLAASPPPAADALAETALAARAPGPDAVLVARAQRARAAGSRWLQMGRRLLAQRFHLTTVTLLVGLGFGAGFWLGRRPAEPLGGDRAEQAAIALPAARDGTNGGSASGAELLPSGSHGEEPTHATDGTRNAATNANAATNTAGATGDAAQREARDPSGSHFGDPGGFADSAQPIGARSSAPHTTRSSGVPKSHRAAASRFAASGLSTHPSGGDEAEGSEVLGSEAAAQDFAVPAPSVKRPAPKRSAVKGAAVTAASANGSGGRATEDLADDALVAEIALLERIERAIRAGEASLALALLEQLDREVPVAALRDERAAARVLAQCLLAGAHDRGSKEERRARAGASRFLEASPASVYADRIRASCPLEEPGMNRRALGEEPGRAGH